MFRIKNRDTSIISSLRVPLTHVLEGKKTAPKIVPGSGWLCYLLTGSVLRLILTTESDFSKNSKVWK